MARTTKQLSGGGKDKFLRALVASEPDISGEAASRLGDTLCAAIADVRARRETWDTARAASAAASVPPVGVAPAQARIASKSKPAARPVKAALAEAAPAKGVAAAPTAAFDPFVFSALAVLAKNGAAALGVRLADIGTAADLHALATAQHLAVDASVTDIAQVRSAILAATEARLAERRAAAS